MRALLRFVAVAGALVAGCAPAVPPPPAYAVRAPDAPVTARWEQFCEQAANVSQASWLASSRGADGWELVGMSNGVLCYKRPEPVRAPQGIEPAPAVPVQMVGARAPVSPPGQVTSAAPGVVHRILEPGF
ncbi:MAG: hypothetical protein R3F14_03490 [Polyangiaceae bacterium]